ncbi:MAG TPA: archease [Burkholderiales bacterium]|nr:archease [Burkholderiales bacterium]
MTAMDKARPAGESYFDHDADIGIIGRGATVEEAFEAAARATFALMTDIGSLRGERSVSLEFEEADVELALVRWLNLLLGLSHEEGLIFGRFWIERDGVCWRGGASGEPWRPELERGVEVKGATLTMLQVRQTEAGWEARCVVDV